MALQHKKIVQTSQHQQSVAVAITLCIGFALSACASRAPEPPQQASPPAAFKELSATSTAINQSIPDRWWTLFNDPVLNDLEGKLVIGNENIKSYVAQVAFAKAALQGAQSNKQPTLSATLSAQRSGSTNSSTAALNPSATVVSNSASLTANAAWEVDLWGRLSSQAKGAEASFNATQADLAAARLSAQATLAQTYFSLRATEAQMDLLQRTVLAYQKSLELTEARHQYGVAALSDVLQAQTQFNSAQTQLADSKAQRAQLEHATAVLLGVAPSGFSIKKSGELPAAVRVPETLPSTLLERRPDIVSARQRVHAAYAQIGVADAAFFPTFNITASAGFNQDTLANLFNAPNMIWVLGASLTQSIFDAGLHRQASDQARASADQSTAAYRQLVLTALQEVEDNLALYVNLADEVQSQTQALDSSQKNLQIVMEQYRAGTVSYLNVTSAQSAALTSESTLVNVRNRQLAAINTLLKNLAGPWEEKAGQP